MAKRSKVGDPSSFQITSEGEVIVTGDRVESRFPYGGVVLLQVPGNKPIRARGRDLSLHGIGIRIDGKLKSYRIGSRLELEFAHPHELSGLLIEVELRRVRITETYDECGFRIVSRNRLLSERLVKLIETIETWDPWVG